MKNILKHNRRPDISFSRNGTIRITATLARILSISPGDTINITLDDGEYLLHVTHHTDNIGRYEAQCYPTNKGGKNYCANSVRLCRSLLDSIGVKEDRAAYMVGEAFDRGNIKYIPIITRHPL